MPLLRSLIAFVGVVSLCTATVAVAEIESSLPCGVRVLSDIAYGADPLQRMDVYLPDHAIARAPVIFMVHGGGWKRGDKAAENVVQNKVARWVPQGFIFVSINYRLLPAADPLTQDDDVARALAAAQNRAFLWGGDPTKFIVVGHSAGAHLVALLAAAPSRAWQAGARPWLGTVVLDSACVDVVDQMTHPHLPLYDDAFGGDPRYWRAASPYHQLTAGGAPMLVVCSTERPDDPCADAERFVTKAGWLGIRAERSPQALSHEEINASLGLPGLYTHQVEAFLASLDPVVRWTLK